MSIYITGSSNSQPIVDSTPTQNSTNLVTSGGVYDAIQSGSGPKFHFEIVESDWPGENQSSGTLNLGWRYTSNGVAITYECGDSISVNQNTGQIIIDNPTIVTYGATQSGDIGTYGNLAGKYIKFLSCTGPDSNQYCTTILGNTSCAWYIPKAIYTYTYSSSNMTVYQAGYSSSDSNKIKRYVAKMVYDDTTFQDTWITLAQKDYSYYYDERDASHTITIGDFSNEIGQIPYYAKKIRFRVDINRLNNKSYYGYNSAKSFYQFYITDSTNSVYLFNETQYNGWRTLDGLSLNCESIFKCIVNGVGANSSVSFTFMDSDKSLVYLDGSTKGQNTGVRIVLNYQLYGYVDINTTCYLDYLI